MSENNPDLSALAGPLRMQLALARFPATVPPLDERFLQWMAALLDVPQGTEQAKGGTSPAFGVSFSADHDRISWWARTGSPSDAPAEAESGGVWIAADNEFEDEGWFATGEMPLTAALDAGAIDLHQPSRLALEQWADSSGCRLGSVAWCTNPAHPYATVSFELPGDDTVDQMMIGLDLFDALGVDGPPHAALAPMLNAPGPLRVVVSLVPDGLRAAGFSASDLGQERLVQLLAADPPSVTETGGTLGVLGVDDPEEVAALSTNAGLQVVLHTLIQD